MAKKHFTWYAWHDADGNGGIFQTWDECQKASSGQRGEKHKGFPSYEEAWKFAYPDKELPSAPVPDTEKKQYISEATGNPKPDVKPVTPSVQDIQETKDISSYVLKDAEKGPVSHTVHQFCMSNSHLQKLSDDQKRAVQAVNGKYLLFAVPGSGKTTVIIARTGYLIHCCGIHPREIMTMTFTRAAASEMHKRYCEYFQHICSKGVEEEVPDFRTIHSFCYSIIIPMLKRKGFACPHHIINEDLKDKTSRNKKYLQRIILRNVLHDRGVDHPSDETVQDAFQTAFTSIKNRQMARDEYSRYSVKVEKNKYPLAPAFEKYQNTLQQLDCMDFDDMLIYALQGLREMPDVLRTIRERYRYWSVDEAQDNSKIQQELMQLLAGPDGNLFMVGDDDQSIYSFRGAEPRLLLNYANQPDVHLLVMGTNFRSDSDIVSTSKHFIENNAPRADKQMTASHKERGIIAVPPSYASEAAQYAHIITEIRKCQQENKKIGILYQLNTSALPLIVHMHRAGIPFKASKGLKDLLRGKVANSALSIMRYSINQSNLELFLDCRRFLNLQWIDEKQADELKRVYNPKNKKTPLQVLLDGQTENSSKINRLTSCITKLEPIPSLKPSEALWKIQREIMMFALDTLPERLAFYSLLTVCDLYSTIAEMLDDLDAMVKAEKQKDTNTHEDEPEEDDQEVVTEGNPFVTLSTIHSAKGREWDHVIIIDSFDEILPGKPQFDRIGYDPQEPKRLFYVAATRAIHLLEIITVESWHGNVECVSRFVPEYAWFADQYTEKPSSEIIKPEEQAQKSSIYAMEPLFYYGVRTGRQPGVYTSYDDVREQTDGYSGAQQKKFTSYAEAWEYAFPDTPQPNPETQLGKDTIRNKIQLSGGVPFNKAMDLPPEVIDGLHSHLGVPALNLLPPERINRMKAQSNLFGKGSQAAYHGHTDGYAAVYMPVNYYKIWLPLWKILEKNKLPLNASILELGPGPGTSTWSLISLYRQLALDNPATEIALHYTAVELETDFSKIFYTIWNNLKSALPSNLVIDLKLISGENAFTFISSHKQSDFNLIIESNLINEDENPTSGTIAQYISGLRNCLCRGGYAILIEPGTANQMEYMNKLMELAIEEGGCSAYTEAEKSSVYLRENTLVKEAIETGLRYSGKMEHWFSYMILEKVVG